MYKVSTGAGHAVEEIEKKIGRRVVIERIIRGGEDIAPRPDTRLETGDEVLLAGPSAAIVASVSVIGIEIEGEQVMRAVPGNEIQVFVTARELHGLTLQEIVDRVGNLAHGVFLRSLTRHDQDVPIVPSTRIYVGDVMTLVGVGRDLNSLVPKIGQPISIGDRTDIAFVAAGLAAGLLIGLISFSVGPVPLALGGGGGALIAGLVCGWWRARRPTIGAYPPAARQVIVDLGLGGFIAAIGLANGPAALTAIQTHGLTLLAVGTVVTLTPMVIGTLFAYYVLRMNPVIVCGALAGAMTVDAAVAGACEVAESQTPILGVAVPYAIANVVLTVLGPIIVGLTSLRLSGTFSASATRRDFEITGELRYFRKGNERSITFGRLFDRSQQYFRRKRLRQESDPARSQGPFPHCHVSAATHKDYWEFVSIRRQRVGKVDTRILAHFYVDDEAVCSACRCTIEKRHRRVERFDLIAEFE